MVGSITRLKSSAKVMFLHLSVILFTGGCLGPYPEGLGGLSRGVSRPIPGGRSAQGPATAAGGTHPTGVHSCHAVSLLQTGFPSFR